MSSAATLRLQIEAALASRIPSALSPAPRILRPVAATGVPELDALLEGGLPLGAITEMVGPECSGRTSVALSFVAQMAQAAKVCAWVDVSNALHPESAAAAGVDLARMLWVRCGVQKSAVQPMQNHFALPEKCLIAPPALKGLHGGGFGPHPRDEIKGISDAVSGFLRPEVFTARCAEPQRRDHPSVQPERTRHKKENSEPLPQPSLKQNKKTSAKPWSGIEQALRVTDLLLQAGGFSAIVLDMAGIAPEHASRVPLATWFRYRAAAERTWASIVLLAQHPCAKSSGELLLRFQPGNARSDEPTVFTGVEHRVEVARRRFTQTPDKVVPLRKPSQSANAASWRSRTTWTGAR
jgi:hypothetical protein